MLRCRFCRQETDGLTLFSIAGQFRLLVWEGCYGRLVKKEHQPHSQPMRRFARPVVEKIDVKRYAQLLVEYERSVSY